MKSKSDILLDFLRDLRDAGLKVKLEDRGDIEAALNRLLDAIEVERKGDLPLVMYA